MGTRLRVFFDKNVNESRTFLSEGKSLLLGVLMGNLDNIAEGQGLTPLGHFVSGPMMMEPGQTGNHAWFDPMAGLETVRGLLRHLRGNPGIVECIDPDFSDFEEGVLGELGSWEGILLLASDESARFQLGVE